MSKLIDGVIPKPTYLAPTCANMLKRIELGIGSFYATKADTRIEGPWFHSPDAGKPEIYDCWDKKLLPWQKYMLTVLNDQCTRRILLVCGNVGGVGKTSLAMWMEWNQPNYVDVPAHLDSTNDIIEYVYGRVKTGKENRATISMDIPRAASECQKSWAKWCAVLERLKSGRVEDGRYTAKRQIIYPPKIVVFCNARPDAKWMTGDVFRIFDLDKMVANGSVTRMVKDADDDIENIPAEFS